MRVEHPAQRLHDAGQVDLAAGQIERALEHFGSAAAQGHPMASVQLARLLLHSPEPQARAAEALALLDRADEAGEASAAYLKAWIGVGGILVPRNFSQINAWMLRSARAGHVPAKRALALHFGRTPDRDSQQLAVGLLAECAETGDTIAAQLLSERLRLGEGVAVDEAGARSLQAQLSAVGVEPLPTIAPQIPHTPACAARPAVEVAFERDVSAVDPLVHAVGPRVATIDGLLTPEECRYIIAHARPRLRRSGVIEADGQRSEVAEIRSSSDAVFDSVHEDFSLRLLQVRIAAAAGVEFAKGEPLVVLRYGPGEQYRPHRDYLSASALQARRPEAGQRAHTVCVYLSPSEAGGETDFPLRGLRIQAKAGRALVFDNLDSAGLPAPETLHAGLPVLSGEKWLATLWLRQRPFRSV